MAQGYDPVFGARPLKRYIQKEVETRLAYKMIEDAMEENCTIQIDFVNNEYVIERVG
jgi:ATP-dependent Clp protease ATP-binding subunit ClpB